MREDFDNAFKSPKDTIDYLYRLYHDSERGRGVLLEPVAVTLPVNSFSELLRAVDPLTVLAKDVDPTAGKFVGPGFATRSAIGPYFDKWGRRRLYTLLFKSLRVLVKLRLDANKPLQPSDIRVLLRCAGAASDLTGGERVWELALRMRLQDGLFEDYLKMRFLTEPLYNQYDYERMRVRPIDLHREKLWLIGEGDAWKIRELGYNTFLLDPLSAERWVPAKQEMQPILGARAEWHRQSDERYEMLMSMIDAGEEVELSEKDKRLIRNKTFHRAQIERHNEALESGSKSRPRSTVLLRLRTLHFNHASKQDTRFRQRAEFKDRYLRIQRHMRLKWPPMRRYEQLEENVEISEGSLCAMMVAFSRSGSVRWFEKLILGRFYGIIVSRAKTREVMVHGDPVDFAPDSPLRPTERLLEAIATSYCNNGEVGVAMRVIDVASELYSIPIPERVWLQIHEWAKLHTTTPISTEWSILGWPSRLLGSKVVRTIWDVMTEPPYNVQPDDRARFAMLRALIGGGHFQEAAAHLLDLEQIYRQVQVELEEAFRKHVACVSLGCASHAAEKAWLDTHARHAAIRYNLELNCATFIKKARHRYMHLDVDWLTNIMVPSLIHALRDFMPDTVEYRVRKGTVELWPIQGDLPQRLSTKTVKIERPALKGPDMTPSMTTLDRKEKTKLERKRRKRLKNAAFRAQLGDNDVSVEEFLRVDAAEVFVGVMKRRPDLYHERIRHNYSWVTPDEFLQGEARDKKIIKNFW